MHYEKIGSIIRNATPAESTPKISAAQMEKLRSAGSIVLALIGAAGIVALSAVAPNMFVAIDKLFIRGNVGKSLSKKERDRKLAKIFYYMKRSRYIVMKPTGKDFKIFLTKLGERKYQKLNFQTLQIQKPEKWDRKWWQVAADIPTKKHKRGADLLRQKLKDMGFYPLQRTLWFYPYDPRPEIEFIISQFRIGRFVTVMEVSRLDLDDNERIKNFFIQEGIL